ncbi:MAG: extracellular solute-binding protein [Acidobacteria bacterium]|nr:extracellular solute-binding protein [Acidobacteriota bacterium]
MLRISIAAAGLALLAACSQGTAPAPVEAENVAVKAEEPDAETLTVYSARNFASDAAIYEAFEEATGIKVSVREGGAADLMQEMLAEGAGSPADVILAPDAGALFRFQVEGLTQPVQSDALEKAVPVQLREKDGNWFGLTKRYRVIVYDPQMLPLEEVDTYSDLAEDRLRGELCVRSSTNISNISLLSELIARRGSEAAEAWATGVASNFSRPPEGGDTAQIEAVAAGQCAAALVNHYYWALLATGTTQERLTAAKTVVSFPDQDGDGTQVNITGAAVAATSKSPERAIRFIEFLVSPEGQTLLTAESKEYPVVAGVALPEGLDLLPNFKQGDFPLSDIGANQQEAQAIFDRAGWN